MSAPLEIVLDLGEAVAGPALRAALSLACVTGRPFTALRVRTARPEPGLRPRDLPAIALAARLCDAEVSGDEVGSQRLRFEPTQRSPAGRGAGGSTSAPPARPGSSSSCAGRSRWPAAPPP